jgi:parallel beta-helix repeat protein
MTRFRFFQSASAVVATVAVFIGARAHAASTCADIVPLNPFLVAGDDARRCQDAVARGGRIYAGGTLKAMQDCLDGIQRGSIAGSPATVCRGSLVAGVPVPPTNGATAGAIASAQQRAASVIAQRCTDAAVAPLDLCADTRAGLQACLVADHWQVVQGLLDAQYGTVVPTTDAGLQQCQRRIGRVARRLISSGARADQRCLNQRNRQCAVANPSARCVGSIDGGVETPPTDPATAGRMSDAVRSLRTRIGAGCTDVQVAALDACADAATDLMDCLECTHKAGVADLLAGEYGGTERYADPTTTIQAVIDAADPGDRIGLAPGTYVETAEVTKSGLSLIGQTDCDGNRPFIDNPNPGNTDNGIFACGSLDPSCLTPADNLLFQGFDMGEFDDNGIFTVGIQGVTFRDLVVTGTGTAASMEYAVFPVFSNDVLIEDCVASGISDAALYVGQSTNIVVRNNEVFNSVAGIEIENSANADVYGNHAHDNTGGILLFKLPGLPVQLSQCHEVFDNLVENNNVPNFGGGFVGLVPQGTGFIALSNDTTIFRDNTVQDNGSFGIALTDQVILNLLFAPPPFPVPSPDAVSQNNFIIDNLFINNGNNPDPSVAGFAADILAATGGGGGNCRDGNTYATSTELPALATTCAQPPNPPGCPYTTTTIATTTTTVSSSSTSTPPTTTTTTTAVPYTWLQTQTIFAGSCSALTCHGAGGSAPAGLADLDDYDAGYDALVNIPATEPSSMDRVEPGDALRSYLMHKLDGTQGTVLGGFGGQMPLGGGPLSQADRDGIRSWINSGAPKN